MSIIICPNCNSSLVSRNRSLKCLNGHSFDIAKQGYVNLLLPNKKKTLDPGDNKLMTKARDEFLSESHYNFLLTSIDSAVYSLPNFVSSEIGKAHLLDLGCGTGYYTMNLFKHLNFSKIGLDISKSAIIKASKRDKHTKYAVASVFNLPILDKAIDIVLNIFSPIYFEELERVLKSGAYYVKVIPGEDHMQEIANLVYDEVVPHSSSIQAELKSNPSFEIMHTEDIKRSISFSGNSLQNLIAMTPYLYKFKAETLSKLNALSVTISFKLIVAQYRTV